MIRFRTAWILSGRINRIQWSKYRNINDFRR